MQPNPFSSTAASVRGSDSWCYRMPGCPRLYLHGVGTGTCIQDTSTNPTTQCVVFLFWTSYYYASFLGLFYPTDTRLTSGGWAFTLLDGLVFRLRFPVKYICDSVYVKCFTQKNIEINTHMAIANSDIDTGCMCKMFLYRHAQPWYCSHSIEGVFTEEIVEFPEKPAKRSLFTLIVRKTWFGGQATLVLCVPFHWALLLVFSWWVLSPPAQFSIGFDLRI